MRKIDSRLLPYPHICEGVLRNGSILSIPEPCSRCANQICKAPKNDELNECSYGYLHQRITQDIILCGILCTKIMGRSEAARKRRRKEPERLVTKESLDHLADTIRRNDNSSLVEIEDQKRQIIEEFRTKEVYKVDFLDSMRKEILQGLSFVHDYKQINAQIIQNINVIVERRYTGANIEEKISKATMEEKAIYQASKLLDEKLNVAKFLMHPEWLKEKSECCKFRVHGLVHKYRWIYEPRFRQKNLAVKFAGESNGEIIANPQAVAVIPHTFIDNAAKYSSKNGAIDIELMDTGDEITFSVSSFGPKIEADEKDRIFEPFFRARDARRLQEEGAGYGLYVSQMVAKHHLGAKIFVHQEKTGVPEKGYQTTFSIDIPLMAKILK